MVRLNRRHSTGEGMNYWPSMVDIMSSTALILFFIMALIATLSYYRSMSYKQIADENTRLMENYKNVADANAILIEEQQQLLADIQQIIDDRDLMYRDLLQRLNDRLGQDMVKRDETRLYIDEDILFVSGKSTLKPEGITLAVKMGEVFYQLLQEQQNNQGRTPQDVQIVTIEVIGHADYDGSFEENRKLSSDRSGIFVELMLGGLNDHDRSLFGKYIKASSMSEYDPVAGSVFVQTDEEKERNRRIEFVINFSDSDFNYLLEKYSKSPLPAN